MKDDFSNLLMNLFYLDFTHFGRENTINKTFHSNYMYVRELDALKLKKAQLRQFFFRNKKKTLRNALIYNLKDAVNKGIL